MNINDLFPSRFLRGDDLDGKRAVVTIEKVTIEEMGKEKEKHPVLWFKGKTRGLVLKKTNAFIIGKLYGPEVKDWIGKRIQLYTKRMHAFGNDQVVICVSEFVPPEPAQAEKPKLQPEEEFLNKVERQTDDNPWDENEVKDLDEEVSEDDIPY